MKMIESLCILSVLLRISYVEEQAIKALLEKFNVNRDRLMKEFILLDPTKTGTKKINHFH